MATLGLLGPNRRTPSRSAGENYREADAGNAPDKRETDISFRMQPVQVAAPRHVNAEVMSRSSPFPFLMAGMRKRYFLPFYGGEAPPSRKSIAEIPEMEKRAKRGRSFCPSRETTGGSGAPGHGLLFPNRSRCVTIFDGHRLEQTKRRHFTYAEQCQTR